MRNGTYAILVDGKPWFSSTTAGFFSAKNWYSFHSLFIHLFFLSFPFIHFFISSPLISSCNFSFIISAVSHFFLHISAIITLFNLTLSFLLIALRYDTTSGSLKFVSANPVKVTPPLLILLSPPVPSSLHHLTPFFYPPLQSSLLLTKTSGFRRNSWHIHRCGHRMDWWKHPLSYYSM